MLILTQCVDGADHRRRRRRVVPVRGRSRRTSTPVANCGRNAELQVKVLPGKTCGLMQRRPRTTSLEIRFMSRRLNRRLRALLLPTLNVAGTRLVRSVRAARERFAYRTAQLQCRLGSGLEVSVRCRAEWETFAEIFIAGTYDDAIEAALKRADRSRPLRVMDLGANVGYFALRLIDLAAQRCEPEMQLDIVLIEASGFLCTELHTRLIPPWRAAAGSRSRAAAAATSSTSIAAPARRWCSRRAERGHGRHEGDDRLRPGAAARRGRRPAGAARHPLRRPGRQADALAPVLVRRDAFAELVHAAEPGTTVADIAAADGRRRRRRPARGRGGPRAPEGPAPGRRPPSCRSAPTASPAATPRSERDGRASRCWPRRGPRPCAARPRAAAGR